MDAQIYIERGRQLTEVGDVADAETHPAALALLSVHAAIAFNDAVLITLTGTRGTKKQLQDHTTAAKRTENACKRRKVDHAGVSHLKTLLGDKTDISYGERRITEQQARLLANAARRFRTWAYKTLQLDRQE